MNHKEALFFIGRSLAISQSPENHAFILKQINSHQVDWDRIVQMSTAHYVFPALFLNLSRANLLSHLPEDLVSYMKHITDLNRERNVQIIAQAKEINRILSKHDISPIFLKGTGFLLQGLYEDIGERMVGDIDFLVSKEDYENTIAILKQNGYSYVGKSDYHFPAYKHYPRIQKNGKIAAVEVHHEMTVGKYKKVFNYKAVADTLIKTKNGAFLSWKNQLILTLVAKQINDGGQYYKTMSLRNGYDIFLWSKKVDSLQAIRHYALLFQPLNHFLSLIQLVFNTESISFESNAKNDRYLKISKRILEDDSFRKRHYKRMARKLYVKSRGQVLFKSFVKKDYRYWLYKRLTSSKIDRD
jgi:hypothetical protein